MQTTQPIIEKEIKDQTQFLYRKGWDGWPKNGSAVWRVEATDGQGKVLGVSEATAFTVKKGWNGVTQDNSANKTSGTCNCVAPTPFYGKEYPSSGLTLSTTNPWPAYIPPSELSSGNKIHFSFTSGPCLNTISDPCHGFYKATVNGIYSFNSTTVGYGSQTHIEIPISSLHTGPNNITVQGICGSTTCDLAPSTVIVSNPPTSSGTITLVKECCTVSDRILPYATHFTGKVSFKMAGSVSSAVLEINSASGLSYEPFVSGGSTACYSKPITIKLVNNLTHVAIGSSTINAAPFLTYNLRFDFSCMKWIKIDISRAFYAALLPHGPRWIDSNLADVANTFDPSLIDGHRLISTLTNTKTKEVVTIKSIVDISENGDMNLIRIEEASSKLNQNNTPIQVLPQKKHSYIGHVTLLK